MNLHSIAVIGVGNIGTSLACDLLLNGFNTVLVDIGEQQLERSRQEILKAGRFASLLNKKLPMLTAKDVEERAVFTTDLQRISDCDFVIENVPEEWSIKEKVYRQIDTICKPGAYFGMNTSCTSITLAAGITSRPSQVVGVHFMNPVYLKDTVEVIRAEQTSGETLAALDALLAKLNKQSIVVKDMPGFVSNRISHLFMNEAAFVVQDQVADPKQVDAIFKQCFGHKMGPLETADLIGLDTVMKSIDTLYENYKDAKFRCCPLLKKMVYAGHLGRKTGKGFYDYKGLN